MKDVKMSPPHPRPRRRKKKEMKRAPPRRRKKKKQGDEALSPPAAQEAGRMKRPPPGRRKKKTQANRPHRNAMGNLMAHFCSSYNKHAQYEASRSRNDSSMLTRTAAAGVTDNPSTLVYTSEVEKKNKAAVAFLSTIMDKMAIPSALIISGLVYSHGPTPLLGISDTWIQVLFAGGVISNISSIILAGSASYFKEIQSPDHPGFVVCSMIVFWELLFFLLLICIILLGFERSSKCVVWFVGVFLLLSVVLVWVFFSSVSQ